MSVDYTPAQEAIRTAVEAAKAAWSDYTLVVEYENADTATVTDANPHLKVDIVYLGGGQLDLGEAPMVEDSGQIMLAACVKVGAGTAKALKLLGHVASYLELRDDIGGGVRTNAAELIRPKTINGIYYRPMIVGFWTQRVSG